MEFFEIKNKKVTHGGKKKFIKVSKIIKYFLLTLFVIIGCFFSSKISAQDEFLKYINQDTLKHYRNGVFLGTFKSQKEAYEYLTKKNPINLENYNFAMAFGMSNGSKPWVLLWETRVLGDNLSWSPLTNYAKLEGLKFDYLVAYSNGFDVATNAIKAGLIKVDNLIAFGPPAGYKSEVKNLPVKSVEIYRTKVDPIPTVIGKKTIFGILQHFGDLDIGIIDALKSGSPIFGAKIKVPWPDGTKGPKVREKIFDGPYYIIKNPHKYETIANNTALNKMFDLERIISTADPKIADHSKINKLRDLLGEYRLEFPEAAKNFDKSLLIPSYWTYRSMDQPKLKTMTEAKIMTEMARSKNRALIFGKGPEVELMYKEMVLNLGKSNVKVLLQGNDLETKTTFENLKSKYGDGLNIVWKKNILSNRQIQGEARSFYADVILGTRDYKSQKEFDLPENKKRPNLTYNEVEKRYLPTRRDLPYIDRRKNFGAAGFPGNDIGGVMLQGVANITGSTGFQAQLTGGTFSFIFQNGNSEIDIGKLRKFVTALWAVYFSNEGPGISIDPIAPDVDKHLVRYIGRVINLDLGRVMRKTDYIMKKWAVGIEKPGIKGFKSVDDLSAKHGIRYLGASRRFWFVPEDMQFKLMGNALLFESGKMTLKTEYVFLNKGAKAEPADRTFAQFFTEHYNEIAQKYPVYQELFEYARYVSLAKYLKKKGIPMLWFLLANKDMVITEDSPGTVEALAKKSEYFEYIKIEGGVDLSEMKSMPRYVMDREAAISIKKAIERYGINLSKSSSALPRESITIESGEKELTLTPSQSLTLSRSTEIGDKFQTDFALRYGEDPGLELVRYSCPVNKGPSTFGNDWQLLIPYQVKSYDDKKIRFLNAVIPEKMTVENLITGDKEVLTFSKDRYRIAGYVPNKIETSNNIGLFLLSDASFRLADKLGNEFQFDSSGRLTEMIFSKDNHIKYKYGYAAAKREELTEMPFRIEPIGNESKKYLNVVLPAKMKLVDIGNGKEEVFVFNENNRYKIGGYIPINEKKSKYTILALMSDASFALGTKTDSEIAFDPAGRFKDIRASVVEGFSQKDHEVKFDYDFKNGQHRIKEARVKKKENGDTLYTIKYQYDKEGRLCKIITPTMRQTNAKIKNDEQQMVTARLK